MEALRGSQACVHNFRKHYEEAKNLMCDKLDELDHVFEHQKPKGSYLMFPKIKLQEGSDSFFFAEKLLKEALVSTTPGIAFQGESHLRMSFCVPMEMITKAFDRMEKYFQ